MYVENKDITEFASYSCNVDEESNHVVGKKGLFLLIVYASAPVSRDMYTSISGGTAITVYILSQPWTQRVSCNMYTRSKVAIA
jgi:hypothetical protein